MVHTVNHDLKDTRFYLGFALEIYICYNRLLFNIYREQDSQLVHTADYIKLIVIEKSMVTFDMFINGKLEVVNFCNIFYNFKSE